MIKKVFFLVFIFTNTCLFSQLKDQKIEGNKISQVYFTTKISSNELFSRIHYAVSLIYQNSNDVIKYKNEESKRMIIKAMALVPVLDVFKLMYPNNTDLSDYIDYKHNYTAIIEVREEKYRIQLFYEDGKYSDSKMVEYKLPFPAKMNFDSNDLKKVMKNATDEMNKSYYIETRRKKKEIYIQSQPRIVKEYQQTLIDYAVIFFDSLHEKIIEDNLKEEW